MEPRQLLLHTGCRDLDSNTVTQMDLIASLSFWDPMLVLVSDILILPQGIKNTCNILTCNKGLLIKYNKELVVQHMHRSSYF